MKYQNAVLYIYFKMQNSLLQQIFDYQAKLSNIHRSSATSCRNFEEDKYRHACPDRLFYIYIYIYMYSYVTQTAQNNITTPEQQSTTINYGCSKLTREHRNMNISNQNSLNIIGTVSNP